MADPRTFRTFFEEVVARQPEAPFLVWSPTGEEVSYEAMNAAIDRAANTWLELGVRRGDRVAFLLDNRPEFLVAWLGLAKIGGVLTAVNTHLTSSEAGAVIRDSGARVVLADPHLIRIIEDPAADLPDVRRVTLGPRTGWIDLADMWRAASDHLPGVDVSADDPISLIYTSGTTGRPKGVVQSHRNYVLTGEAYPHWMTMRAGERIYACLPLFHINAQAYSTFGAVGADGAIVLSPRFSGSRFWDEVRRYEVGVFNFIGAMITILAKAPATPADRDHRVHTAYGVPALPVPLRDEFETRFGLRIRCGFGMSETTFGLIEPADRHTLGPMGYPRSHPDPSVPTTEAKLVDRTGAPVAPGVPGELLLRSATVMLGYHGDPEATADAFTADGWLRTGDHARRCPDGSYEFVDRAKDLIRRRGENISSAEIESVVIQHPDVHECAAVGVPSAMTDEEVLVYVVPRPDARLTPDGVVAWCQPRLAPFKVPRFVAFLDRLPRTPTEKVEKHRLRDRGDSDRWYDAGRDR